MSTILKEIYNTFLKSSGISIDSRTVKKNNIFFAISGINFDGHDYLNKALESGALAVVIDKPEYAKPPKMITTESLVAPLIFCVADTVNTLQQLARMYRDTFQIPVLGITGSNGKTTTKELIAKVIGKKYKVHFTKGNLNNHLGVPLTLLAMPRYTEITIIEMGANHLGEIADLCKIADPTVGLITNIGKAHIGEFGSFENIVKTKLALFKYVVERNGNILVNIEDEHIKDSVAKEYEHVLTYSRRTISTSKDKFAVSLQFVEENLKNQVIIQDISETCKFETKLYGNYNQINIAAAIACGIYWSVPVGRIAEAIEAYIPLNKRSQIIRIGTNTILLDAYNANPDSMKVAIQEIIQLEIDKKVLILGDMLELGKYAKDEHQMLLDWVLQQDFDEIYLVGEVFPRDTRCKYYSDWQSLKKVLKFTEYSQTAFLIKGSRKFTLENLVIDFL